MKYGCMSPDGEQNKTNDRHKKFWHTERETSEVRNYGSYAREARKRHGVTRVRVLSKVLFRLDRLVLSRIRNSQNNCSGQGEASHPEYRTSCFRLEDRRKRLRTCEHNLNAAFL